MRFEGLDAARYLAFCGMVLVNFRIAAQVTPGGGPVSALTDALEGRAAALFVVLAGIGLGLARPAGGTVLRRAGFLFAAGLLNLMIFEADILHFYALYFLLALPFVGASAAWLWAGTGAVIAVSIAGFFLLDYEAQWNWETLAYADFWTVEGFLRHSFFNGWHPVFPWTAFLLFGIWLGRLDLRSARLQRQLIVYGSLAAALGLIPRHFAASPGLAALLGTGALPPGPFYMLSAGGSAAAVAGLVLLLSPALERFALLPWLAVPGRQALSLYIAHIVIGMGTMEAFGWLGGTLTPRQIFGISLAFCAASSVCARIWQKIFHRGPLEALMRRLT